MNGRQRKTEGHPIEPAQEQDVGITYSTDLPNEKPLQHAPTDAKHRHHIVHMPHLANMPGYNHNGHKVTKGIKPDGESGRAWIHPVHFLRICFRSSSTASRIVNYLWPFVPAAIAIHFIRPSDQGAQMHCWTFALNYIAMVPTANLIGFAGQELARKLPKVFGKQAFLPFTVAEKAPTCFCRMTTRWKLHLEHDMILIFIRHHPRDLFRWHRRNRSVHGPPTQ